MNHGGWTQPPRAHLKKMKKNDGSQNGVSTAGIALCARLGGKQRARRDGPNQASFDSVGRNFQIVKTLEIQPPTGARAKVARESERCVHGDRSLAPHNLADANGRDANRFRQRGLIQSQGLHKVVQ